MQPNLSYHLLQAWLYEHHATPHPYHVRSLDNDVIEGKRYYLVVLEVDTGVDLDYQARTVVLLSEFLKNKGYHDGEIWTMERLWPAVDP